MCPVTELYCHRLPFSETQSYEISHPLSHGGGGCGGGGGGGAEVVPSNCTFSFKKQYKRIQQFHSLKYLDASVTVRWPVLYPSDSCFFLIF